MPSTIETKGRCLCGDVKYPFSTLPAYAVRCHCRDCQKACGSTNTTLVPIPRSDLVVDDESALKQSRSFKHHASDVALMVSFCGNCGCAIFKEASSAPGMAIVFMGTVDYDGNLIVGQPMAEIWRKYRVPWNAEVKGAKQCQGWDIPA